MKKNIWIGVLAVTVLALATFVGFQSQQIAAMKEQVRAMIEVERAMAKAARAPKRAPVEETAAPLPEAKPVEPVAAPATIVPAGGTTNNSMAGFAEMMKNPQMKEMIRAQQKMYVDGMYGALSKYLDLSTNDMAALKELLLQRQMALMDSGMAMMNGSAADQKQAAADAQSVKADYDKKIQDLLGAQDYPVFQDYEKTAADRMSVQLFKSSLPAETALTDQQEESLITAMAEERTALPPTSVMNNQTPDPSKFSEEGIADTLKQMDALQQRDVERAAAILTPAQLDQFTKFQQQMSAMAGASMRMAGQMFGNKSAAPAPAASPGP